MTAPVRHSGAVELVERAKLRRKVARAVNRLIAILDELDADSEAEPWLGAVVLFPSRFDKRLWACAANDDREQNAGAERELEDEHGDVTDAGEPSLGAAEGREDQGRWAQGNRRNLAETELLGETLSN